MGFRWRKSFKIFPGLRFNVSHRGVRLQFGASPLSFSIPLWGGSRQRRLTASAPGTGLSFVSSSAPKQRRKAVKPAFDHRAAMVEAVTQAAKLRLIPLRLPDLLNEPPEIRREIVRSALPRFMSIMKANGYKQTPHGMGPEAIDDFSDEKIEGLIAKLIAIDEARCDT